MYKLKYRHHEGWQEISFTDEGPARAAFDIFSEVYRFVTLSRIETVTNEVTISDSSAA